MNIQTTKQTDSRHPKLMYWFWDEKLPETDGFEKQLDTLCQNSDFDTVILTERDGLWFFDKSMKPYFEKAVKLAHARGLKIILQIWPRAYRHKIYDQKKNEAVALAVDSEGVVTDGTVTLESTCTGVKPFPHTTYPLPKAEAIANEIIRAYAFKKTGEGFYDKNTLSDVTEYAVIEKNRDETLTVRFDLEGCEGYTVFMTVAHYYAFPDLFGPGMENDYRDIIDYYGDCGFDSFVLDEFKNFCVAGPWSNTVFRDRIYGDHFKKYFNEYTGKDLDRILFDMRYCPANNDNVRIYAINLYFDIFRHSTKRFEKFMSNYVKGKLGNDAFDGLHNTFHNTFHDDEMWTTCCNWWEVPRKYAQTDENIAFPIRMGIACQCSEPIVYDMYYNKEKQTFADKAMIDAAFGCRIHYHAMNDGFWGIDTGSREFLDFIMPVESKITLLNRFDPKGLPKMELLVVFGFPNLCNWYPYENARGNYDININVNIENRCKELWNSGYLNALAPSDAVDDGRITLDENGRYDYCGHKFEKMLYLYPQYAKPTTIEALKKFAIDGRFAVIGEISHDFNGDKADSDFLTPYVIGEDADIVSALKLTENRFENGCELEDGSVVLADKSYSRVHSERTDVFKISGHIVKAVYRGVFAVKLNENGKIEKTVGGDCKLIEIDGEMVVNNDAPQDVCILGNDAR